MEAEVGGALVALDPGARDFLEFSPVAASVWHMLAEPRSFDQLRDALIAEYDVASEECTDELRRLLDDLGERGLVDRAPLDDANVVRNAPTGLHRARSRRFRSSVSPEFALVVECCGSAFAGGEWPVIAEGIDWLLFLRLARFHRVQGLVWHGLSNTNVSVPDDVAEALVGDASEIAAGNLRAAVDCGRLQDGFTSEDMTPLFVKGLTVGALAYGNPALKYAVDIDVLVDDAQLEQAADWLQHDGYRLHEPAGPYRPERLRDWHGPGKESTWVRSDPWSVVDLHTRLSDNPRLIPAIGPNSQRRMVEISKGIRLPTLEDEELVAYLCVHGASSAWFRLKWITDLAALLHRRGAAEVAHFYRRSQELVAGRAADQALLLADALFETLHDNPALREQLVANPRSRWLCQSALRQLAGRVEPIEPTARRGGTARIHLTQFFLIPGVAFKASEFVRQARAALR